MIFVLLAWYAALSVCQLVAWHSLGWTLLDGLVVGWCAAWITQRWVIRKGLGNR